VADTHFYLGKHSMSNTNKKILIADDHVLLAESVGVALAAAPRHFESMVATTLAETKLALETKEKFDLVLLDIRMPGMMGLKSIHEVVKAADPAPVALLSGTSDMGVVNAAVDFGSRGLIPKTLPLTAMVNVVDLILSGQAFIPVSTETSFHSGSSQQKVGLTNRESSVLRLASEGLTNKEIAFSIGSTEVNVKMHMRSICNKLNARNRAHAVVIGKDMSLF